ncbi:MAG: Ditrans,polycis-undecaprenyl-diphosphate synthase ((2E,6E)-farnesyl-diphosphate specific) [Alphaproteobacteria bacterium MarineAlpha8_Bin1]|nr:MAG: Ditrans,polycis-undecaprenyl-diphosphate synthase ((2E,6E)-farnesyl-diphosphate specific) [Alphaproteobacteria bacterium MarineAlpha8_Bin1]|tara:strand:- start:342 stop:1046 length:705 start_codon:yes stop_codon:yes gene_type:complete
MPFNFKNEKCLPSHVAFIMDGNRRWAKKNGLSPVDGHKMGSNVVKKIVQTSLKLKIKYLTFFSFSTENWTRKKMEVKELQDLLDFYLDSEVDNFRENQINFRVIGDLNKFKFGIKKKILKLEEITASFNKLFLVLALSYGSRSEILNAVKNIKKKSLMDVTEEDINKNLMTKNFPDPDLVIRTSGEKRLSNFLLWQIAYSELYFTKTLWPDFNAYRFKLALQDYINRKRRFGGD